MNFFIYLPQQHSHDGRWSTIWIVITIRYIAVSFLYHPWIIKFVLQSEDHCSPNFWNSELPWYFSFFQLDSYYNIAAICIFKNCNVFGLRRYAPSAYKDIAVQKIQTAAIHCSSNSSHRSFTKKLKSHSQNKSMRGISQFKNERYLSILNNSTLQNNGVTIQNIELQYASASGLTALQHIAVQYFER